MRFAISTAFSDPSHLLPIARAADACGYEAVAVSDHLVMPERLATRYPYTPDGSPRWSPFTPWPDPWVAIAAMAAVTERVRFLTSVYVLPLRNPFLVAKAVGTAAVLSGNRVALGVGMGWMEEEFRLVEQPFAGRGARADEMLDVLRALWAGGWVEHHGAHYDFERLEMTPAPTAPVPILVGGLSAPALRRAARHDGWISDIGPTAQLAATVERLRALRAEQGRAGEPFEVVAAVDDAAGVDGYRRVEEAGATILLTMPWVFYAGFTEDLDAKLDGIRRFADDVLPHFA